MKTEAIHKYGYNVLSQKKNKLYFQNKLLVELIPHETYPKHWHLKFCWREEKTPEFFNAHNAWENSKRITLCRLNYDTWE